MKKENFICSALVFVFGICLLGLVSKSEATTASISPKPGYALNYTTTVSTVAVGPCSVYRVMLATGAAGEYVAFFDSATVQGLNSTTINSTLKTRLFFGSTTATTSIVFDPPLEFYNGLMVGDSASTGQSVIQYDLGRSGGQ